MPQIKTLTGNLRSRNARKIRAAPVSKALMIAGIMLFVTIIPFITLTPSSVSNAYSPGPRVGVEGSVSESDMPTFVSSASNPFSVFQYTGMSLSLKYVAGSSGGHQIYTYFNINASKTSHLSTSNVVYKTEFNPAMPINSLYWYAINVYGRDYGTVGADIQINSQDGDPTVDQYVNVNYNGPLGHPNDSPLAHCNTAGTDGYPPSVDTGGEERWAVNTVITDPSQSLAYVITGGMILYRSNGEADLIILVNPLKTAQFDFSSYCDVPSLTFSSNEIDWAIRAPPSFNTVSGSYELYPTVGGSLEKSSGPGALINRQYFDPNSAWSSTTTTFTTSPTTSTTATTTSTIPTTSSTTMSTSSTTPTTTVSTSSASSTSLSTETSTVSSSTSSTSSSSTKTTTTSSFSTVSSTLSTTSSTQTSTTHSTTTSSTTTDSSTATTTTSSSSSSTSTSETSTTTSISTSCNETCENPYWNPNSQEVANYVVNNLFNSQVGLIATSSLQGCIDYVGGLPCQDTFWTTSDNVPTGWTLQDFGYPAVTQAIINECNYLQCSSANSGDRYEAYIGWPIAIGSPGDIHGIFSPGTNTITLTCSTSGCGDNTPAYGTLSDGTPYKIQADVYTGSAGSPNPNGAVDVVGPQVINYYIRGDMTDSLKYATALVDLWNGYSVDGSGGGDTWHLGQVMFVMRVLGLDTSTNTTTTEYGTQTYAQVFQQMENELWAIQAAFNCNGGCLPNSYTQTSPGGTIVGTSGVDAENQDAGLLPFSYSVVSMVRSDSGKYSTPGNPALHIEGKRGSSIKSASISPLVFVVALSTFVGGSIAATFYTKRGRESFDSFSDTNSLLTVFRKRR